MKLIVDRIESGIAVLEKDDLDHIEVPVEKLPKGTNEGSVLTENPDGSYSLDLDEEALRKKRFLEMQNKLFKN